MNKLILDPWERRNNYQFSQAEVTEILAGKSQLMNVPNPGDLNHSFARYLATNPVDDGSEVVSAHLATHLSGLGADAFFAALINGQIKSINQTANFHELQFNRSDVLAQVGK